MISAVRQIDGKTFRNMIIGGVNALIEQKGLIDSLNVFPVPDGDTGTNLSLTGIATAAEVANCDSCTVCELAAAAASGSLRGARGNSGVILSQLFRGFAKGVEGREVITAADLARGFERGAETAYKAVLKPKEGTILTAASQTAKKAAELAGKTDDIAEIGREVLEHGERVVERTRDMLPALREAGVVDAGAKGLMVLLRGAFEAMDAGGELVLNRFDMPAAGPALAGVAAGGADFGYCTEFMIHLNEQPAAPAKAKGGKKHPVGAEAAEGRLRSFLSAMGDSIEVAGYDNMIRVHVHTQHPGVVLERALKFGYLTNLKIENMTEQHTRLNGAPSGADRSFGQAPAADQAPPAETGFVAVASGEGLAEVFAKLGAERIVAGGQTMNPSAQDILEAIDAVNARTVFVLPNNKNIVFAARQAAELSAASADRDKNVVVLNTESVPQGIAAMVSFMPNSTPEENISAMDKGIREVVSGRVTRAVRASKLGGLEINKGDFVGILEEDIVTARRDVQSAAESLIEKMLSKAPEGGADFISVYYGEGVGADQAEALGAYIEESRVGVEYEIRFGGQPVYEYIISVE